MAGDTREWYRDWWNKKTGYVEKASFRVSQAELERRKMRAAWRRNFLVAGAVVGLVTLIAVVKRTRRR